MAPTFFGHTATEANASLDNVWGYLTGGSAFPHGKFSIGKRQVDAGVALQAFVAAYLYSDDASAPGGMVLVLEDARVAGGVPGAGPEISMVKTRDGGPSIAGDWCGYQCDFVDTAGLRTDLGNVWQAAIVDPTHNAVKTRWDLVTSNEALDGHPGGVTRWRFDEFGRLLIGTFGTSNVGNYGLRAIGRSVFDTGVLFGPGGNVVSGLVDLTAQGGGLDFTMTTINDAVGGNFIDAFFARGTLGSLAAVHVADTIFGATIHGYDGSGWTQGGAMDVQVDAAPSAGILPLRWSFFSQDLAGNVRELVRFDGADATAGDMRMLLWDVSAGALVRVSRDAADTAGAGFRRLRVPN